MTTDVDADAHEQADGDAIGQVGAVLGELDCQHNCHDDLHDEHVDGGEDEQLTAA